MEEEQVLKLIQENMAGVQQKNQELENKIAELQLENRRMKVEAQGAATRIKKNKEVWKSLCDGITEFIGRHVGNEGEVVRGWSCSGIFYK